jgi:hypothetical protein
MEFGTIVIKYLYNKYFGILIIRFKISEIIKKKINYIINKRIDTIIWKIINIKNLIYIKRIKFYFYSIFLLILNF